jgi:hypothetical protein
MDPKWFDAMTRAAGEGRSTTNRRTAVGATLGLVVAAVSIDAEAKRGQRRSLARDQVTPPASSNGLNKHYVKPYSTSTATPYYKSCVVSWGDGECTGAPDGPFTKNCIAHDKCYRKCEAMKNRAFAWKLQCDKEFKASMYATCRKQPWYARPNCFGRAEVMYRGVRTVVSDHYYEDGIKKNCIRRNQTCR